jgi:hypothetical protein
MTLSDLASLGSFVSGIAVLLSFIFLALQLRQGNINQRALIQTGRTTRIVDVLFRRLDPHLHDIGLRGNRGDTSMSADEIEAYLQISYTAFLNFEDTYLQVRAGTIHPEAWTTGAARLRQLMEAPGFRVAWKKWRYLFGSDFVHATDQIVLQARSSGLEERSASWAADIVEEIRLGAK